MVSRRDLRSPAAGNVEETLLRALRRAFGSGSDAGPGRRTASGRHLPEPGRHSAVPARGWTVLPSPALGLGLSVVITVTGVAVVHADTVDRQQRAAVAAVAYEEARRDRVADAATDRLTGQATTFAAERRSAALVAAREALEAAQAVATVADDVVDHETVAPLDEAAAALADLLAKVPDPVDVLGPDQRETATSRSADLPRASAGDAPSDDGSVEAASDDASITAPERPAADESGPSDEADRAGAGGARGPLPEPLGEARRSPEGPRTTSVSALAPRPTDEALRALDLTATAEVLAAAERLSELSEEVRAAADIALAERAAAERAAQEKAAAEREAALAAAAERARKIAAAASSPNGQIAREVLCGVSFDADTLLRCDAAEALEELNAAYRQAFGRNLEVISSYRDVDTQVRTKWARGDLAAVPGTSNHGLGIAVDFAGFGRLGQFGSANYLWMREHGGRFGWIHPEYMRPGGSGPLEPWHWEYTG